MWVVSNLIRLHAGKSIQPFQDDTDNYLSLLLVNLCKSYILRYINYQCPFSADIVLTYIFCRIEVYWNDIPVCLQTLIYF